MQGKAVLLHYEGANTYSVVPATLKLLYYKKKDDLQLLSIYFGGISIYVLGIVYESFC